MGRKTEAAARMRAMEVELDELFERCKYLTSRIEKAGTPTPGPQAVAHRAGQAVRRRTRRPCHGGGGAVMADDDVTRLAEILARDGVRWMSETALATYLVRDEGVTLPPPPPDPAVVVTKEIAARVWPDMGWGPVDLYPVHADLAAAVRDLFTTDAIEAAAAKVQEAET